MKLVDLHVPSGLFIIPFLIAWVITYSCFLYKRSYNYYILSANYWQQDYHLFFPWVWLMRHVVNWNTFVFMLSMLPWAVCRNFMLSQARIEKAPMSPFWEFLSPLPPPHLVKSDYITVFYVYLELFEGGTLFFLRQELRKHNWAPQFSSVQFSSVGSLPMEQGHCLKKLDPLVA